MAVNQPIHWQRITIGLIAIALLVGGGMSAVSRPYSAGGVTGICIRLGLVLGVIWLAWPQLSSMKTKLSALAVGVCFLLLAIAAFRPNAFRVVAGLIAVTIALQWGLGWVSKLSRP